MTLDEALADAARQLDALLEERWAALPFEMIASGLNPDDRELAREPSPDSTLPPLPPGLQWERLTFDEAIERQKAIDRRWRAGTLDTLRRSAAAELAKKAAAPSHDGAR